MGSSKYQLVTIPLYSQSIALTLLHMDAVEADVIMAEEVATMIAGMITSDVTVEFK